MAQFTSDASQKRAEKPRSTSLVIEEKLTINHHLDSRGVLFLFDVNMCYVHPYVGKIRGGFSNLRENIAGLVDEALVRQHTADPMGRPDVVRVSREHRLVAGKRSLLQRKETFSFSMKWSVGI